MRTWFSGLKVPQKLALISGFFILPNALMLYFFVTGQSANIDFARREQEGIEYQRPLESLLELFPLHSRLSEQEATGEIVETEARIDTALTELAGVDARLGRALQFTDEGLARRKREHFRPATLRAEWDELRMRSAELTPEDRAARHRHLLADVRMMIRHVGDTSNLILDPDLDTYYLMDATLLALPESKERFAEVLAFGRTALTDPGSFAERRLKLAIHAALLRESDFERIMASLQTALNEDADFYGTSASLQANLPPVLVEYSAATEAFIAMIERAAASDTPVVTPEEFLAAGLLARTSSVKLWRVAAQELDRSLQMRIDHYRNRRTVSELLAVGALLAAIFFVTVIARSITRPLRRQAAELLTANQSLEAHIVERERAEASLRESEVRMRAVVDTALDAVVTMNPAGMIIGWNAQAETIFGWKREEAVGRSLSDTIVPAQYREAHERGLKRFLSSGHGPVLNKRIEITALHRDGREFAVELAITPLKTESGLEFSAFLRDISARKQADEERERLVSFLEASFNEVYVFDPVTLRFSYVNSSALKNLGYTAEEIRELTPLDLKREFSEASFRQLAAPLLTGTIPRKVFQTMHRRADGSSYPVEICMQVVASGGSHVILAVGNDITERRANEDKMAEMNRQYMDASRKAGMAEVATGVLHNVGNVLNSVNVSVETVARKVQQLKAGSLGKLAALLAEHAGDPAAFFATAQGARLPEFLSQLAEHFAAEQTTALAELKSLKTNVEHINEIVSMQQEHAGAGGVTEVLAPTEVIEDALRVNAAGLDRHGATVVREYDPSVSPLPLDRHKILLILINLISNAKYAMSEPDAGGKVLTVRTVRRNGDLLAIEVTDEGVGIAAEQLTRIFQHGFTTKKTGHGFGLHASALAAREMGGALQVTSPGRGRGATFTLELPLPVPSR